MASLRTSVPQKLKVWEKMEGGHMELNFDERNQQDNSIDCCCNHLCWRVLPVVKKQSEQSVPTQALASAPTAEFFFQRVPGPLYFVLARVL
jgi:hypothetical protein